MVDTAPLLPKTLQKLLTEFKMNPNFVSLYNAPQSDV